MPAKPIREDPGSQVPEGPQGPQPTATPQAPPPVPIYSAVPTTPAPVAASIPAPTYTSTTKDLAKFIMAQGGDPLLHKYLEEAKAMEDEGVDFTWGSDWKPISLTNTDKPTAGESHKSVVNYVNSMLQVKPNQKSDVILALSGAELSEYDMNQAAEVIMDEWGIDIATLTNWQRVMGGNEEVQFFTNPQTGQELSLQDAHTALLKNASKWVPAIASQLLSGLANADPATVGPMLGYATTKLEREGKITDVPTREKDLTNKLRQTRPREVLSWLRHIQNEPLLSDLSLREAIFFSTVFSVSDARRQEGVLKVLDLYTQAGAKGGNIDGVNILSKAFALWDMPIDEARKMAQAEGIATQDVQDQLAIMDTIESVGEYPGAAAVEAWDTSEDPQAQRLGELSNKAIGLFQADADKAAVQGDSGAPGMTPIQFMDTFADEPGGWWGVYMRKALGWENEIAASSEGKVSPKTVNFINAYRKNLKINYAKLWDGVNSERASINTYATEHMSLDELLPTAVGKIVDVGQGIYNIPIVHGAVHEIYSGVSDFASTFKPAWDAMVFGSTWGTSAIASGLWFAGGTLGELGAAGMHYNDPGYNFGAELEADWKLGRSIFWHGQGGSSYKTGVASVGDAIINQMSPYYQPGSFEEDLIHGLAFGLDLNINVALDPTNMIFFIPVVRNGLRSAAGAQRLVKLAISEAPTEEMSLVTRLYKRLAWNVNMNKGITEYTWRTMFAGTGVDIGAVREAARAARTAGLVKNAAEQELLYSRLGAHLFEQKTATWLSTKVARLGGLAPAEFEVTTALKAISKNTELVNYESWFYSESQKMFKDRFTSKGMSRVLTDKIFQWVRLQKENQVKGLIKLTDEELHASLTRDVNSMLAAATGIRPGKVGKNIDKFGKELESGIDRGAIDDFYKKVATIREAAGPVHSMSGRLTKAEKAAGVKVTKRTLAVNALKAKIVDESFWDIGTDLISNKSAVRRADEILAMFHDGSLLAKDMPGQVMNVLPHIAGPIKALHVATARRMGMTTLGSPVIQKIRQLTSDVPTLVADIEGDLGAFMYMYLRRANVHTPAKQAELVAQAASLSLRMRTMKKGTRETAFALFMQNVGTDTTKLILEKYHLIDWTKIEKIADKEFLLRGLNDAMSDRTYKTIEEAKQALIDGMYRQVAEKVWHGTLSLNASLYGITTDELAGAIESGQDLVKITARNRTYKFDGSDKVFESLEKAKVAAKQYALANKITSGVKIHTLDPLFETQLPNMWAMFDPHRLEDTIRQAVGWHESFNQRLSRAVGSERVPKLFENEKYRGLLTGKTTTKFVFDQTIKRLVDKVLFLWKFSVVATPRYVLRVPFGDEQLRMMADLGFFNYLNSKKLAALGNHVDTTLRLPLDMGSVKLQEALAASGLNIEEAFDMLLAQETRNLTVAEIRQLQQIPTEVRQAMQAQIDGHASRVLNPKHEEVFPTSTDGINVEGDFARIIAAPNPGSEPLTDRGLLESQAGRPGSSSETPLADYEEALATREVQSRGLAGSRVPAHEARVTVATAEQARHEAALSEVASEASSPEDMEAVRAIQLRYGSSKVTDAVLAAAEGKLEPARLKQLSVFESTLRRQAIGPASGLSEADKAHATMLMKIVREIAGDPNADVGLQLAKIVDGVSDDAAAKTALDKSITELLAGRKVAATKNKIADPELEALANSIDPNDPIVQEQIEGLFAEYADVTAERSAFFDQMDEPQQIQELKRFKKAQPDRWSKISKDIGPDATHAEAWSAFKRLRLGLMDAQFKRVKADLRRYNMVLELSGFNHEAAQSRWFASLAEMIRLNGDSAGTPDDIRDFFRLSRDEANRRLEQFSEEADVLETPRTEAMGDDYISDNNGPVADVDRKGATLDQTPTTHLVEQMAHTADIEAHGKKLAAYEGFVEKARKIQGEIDDSPLREEFRIFLDDEAKRVGHLIEKSSTHKLVHRFLFERIDTIENEGWRKFAKLENARVFYPDEDIFKKTLVQEGEKLRLKSVELRDRQDVENTLASVRQDLTMQPIPWEGLPGELPHDAPIGQLFVFPDRSVGRVEEIKIADLIRTQDPALLQADVVTDMRNSADLKLPLIERTNDGKLHLLDGHHRVASKEIDSPTMKVVIRDVESMDPLAKKLVYDGDRFFLKNKDGDMLDIIDHPRAGIWESITAFAESRPSLHGGQTMLIDSGELLPEVRELFTEGSTMIGFDLTKSDSSFLTKQMITDMTRLAKDRKAAGLKPQTVVLVRSGDRVHDAAVIKALKDQDIDVSVVEVHQGVAAGYPMSTHETKYNAPGPNGAPNPRDRKNIIDRARQRGETPHPDEGIVWIDKKSGIFGPGEIAPGGTKEDSDLFWQGWEKTHYEAASRTSETAIPGRRQLLFDYAGKILLGDWRTWDIAGRDFNTGKHLSDLIHRIQQEESIFDLVKRVSLQAEDETAVPIVRGSIDPAWILEQLPPYLGSTRLLDQSDIIHAIEKLPDDPRGLRVTNDVEKILRDAIYGEASDKEVSALLKQYHLAASRRNIIAYGYNAQNIKIPPGDYKQQLLSRISVGRESYSPEGFPTATERGLAQTASEWKPSAAIFYGGSQTSPGLVNNIDQLRRQGVPVIARVSAGKQNFVQSRLTNLKARKVVQHKKEQMQIFGRYVHGEKTIYINAEAYGNEDWRQLTLAFDGSKRYDSYQKIRAMNPELAIRVHEEGHAAFYQLSGPKLDKLTAVMRKVGHKIPGSAAVDPGEYFSDLYMLWVLDPDSLAKEYPDLAKFMGSDRGAIANLRKNFYSGKPGTGLNVERIKKYTHDGEATILDPEQMTIPVHHVRETGAEPEELAVNTGSAGTLMGGIVNELEKDSSFFKNVGRDAKLDHKELDPVALWNQMPAKWDSAKRTNWMSKFYVPQWAAALTHHYAYSAIGKEILQGIADNRPIQDIASYVRRMLRENTGDLAARLNVDSRNLDDEVALRVEQIMTATMGDSRIASAALRAGRENNQVELLSLLNQVMTIDGAKNMPNISGLLPVPGEKGPGMIPKTIEAYSRNIFETSTNKASRQPYFHKAESDYKMALIGQAMANNEAMTVDTIQNIKMFARESAIADTWDLLFDFRRNSRLAEMMRMVVPFSQPFAEALIVWGRLLQKNPGFFHHLVQIGKTLQDYDVMIQEADGTWNMKVPMIGPWLAALGQWTGNLIGPQNNTKFDNSQFNLVFPVSSLNFFLSSTIDIAGLPIPVPSASVPVTAFEQWLSGQDWVPDEAAAFLTKHAYQYGSVQTAGNFTRSFLPRWMNTVVLPLLGVDDPQTKLASQEFVSLMEDQGITPDSLYSNKALAQSVAGRTFVDVSQAQKWFQDAAEAQGTGFSVMRGFFGSIFPAPPNFHMPTYEADKLLTDLRAKYQGRDDAFDKVRTAFLKEYPHLTSMLVASTLWTGTDIGTIKIPAFEGLSKIFNSKAADDISKINPALVFALAPEEAWGQTYDRVEYMKALDQGWYTTADIEPFVGNWQTFEGWRAYNTATEERDKDIAAVLADGTVDENGPEVQAVNEYFNNVTIPFLKEHNPAWAEEFHPSGGTFNPKFFNDIRRALKIPAFSKTSTGQAMTEYFTFRDAMKKEMAMKNLSGLENSVAEELGYTKKYDSFVEDLQGKYGLVFKLFFDEYVAGDLMDDSFLTHGEVVFNNLSKLGKETSDVVHANMGDWQLIQDRISNYQPGSSDDPGSISVLYNNAKDQSNEWWDLYGESLKNPTWVWWETNTYSEKLSYKQSIAARPFTYLSTFDKEVVLGIPTTPETEAIWAKINFAQTNAQIIDDTGAVSDSGIWYDEADRIAYQNLTNFDFATQLYYANTWGWGFFQATGYTKEGHATAEDWRAVQNLVQRDQQTANSLEWSGTSDFDPLKKYGYVQLRSNLVAYIEERAKQSPLFAKEYKELVAAYNPFVDVLIPESYFLLGVDYNAG